MATLSSILSWRIPCTEEPGGVEESDMTEQLTDTHTKSEQYRENAPPPKKSTNRTSGVCGTIIKIPVISVPEKESGAG